MNETVKDFSSGEMLLKILTAEKERLAKVVLEEGSTSRKSSDPIWHTGVGMSGLQSGGALKSDMETLPNDNSAWKSTSSPVQVGWLVGWFISCRFLCRITSLLVLHFCHVHSCSMAGFFETPFWIILTLLVYLYTD